MESVAATAAAAVSQEREMEKKQLATALEEKKNFEGSATAMQLEMEQIKREKAKLQEYIQQQEGEVKQEIATKGEKMQGLSGQVRGP
eukprot:744629-Prorocentrum_minimum.AAC.1